MTEENILTVKNVPEIGDSIEFEGRFIDMVLKPVGVVEAYERERDGLENTFRERFEDGPLEAGIAYLDDFYHMKDVKDHCEYAHDLAAEIARRMYAAQVENGEISKEGADAAVKAVKIAAIGHDVGKKVFPPELLDDIVELDDTQHRLVKAHPIISYLMIKNIKRLRHAANYVLYHEEFYNGGGPVENILNAYLSQLKEEGGVHDKFMFVIKGEDIPPGARILKLADAYASMKRREKTAKEIKKAFATSTEFDPKIARLCLLILNEEGKI